jgi:hypothetical protein
MLAMLALALLALALLVVVSVVVGHTSLFLDLPKMSTTHVARFSVIYIVSSGVSE